MRRLNGSALTDAFESYRMQSAFFPLIGAVLEGNQDGVVFADSAAGTNRFYVEHVFGFAQVFGYSSATFDEQLNDYLIVKKAFAPAKVRLYTPEEPEFLAGMEFDFARSRRQRFVLDAESPEFRSASSRLRFTSVRVSDVEMAEVPLLDRRFQLVTRFWRDELEFLQHSRAVVVWQDTVPVAICYAAAVSNGFAEVDVLTLPEFRKAGYGALAVQGFNERCLNDGLIPVWDCYTNNVGSMVLCQKTGFKAMAGDYAFYTLGH